MTDKTVVVLVCAALPLLAGDQELRLCLRAEPKTFNPLMTADDASDTIRYLTGGVLIRVNRLTQELQPELATSWTVLPGRKSIRLRLRDGLRFSDGTRFSAEDVAWTFRTLMAPGLHSPIAESFRSAEGTVVAQARGAAEVTLTFPAPVAGLERLFDQVAILSATSPAREKASLGPFFVAEHKAGSFVQLRRNPYYWKVDKNGRRLPYLDAIRLEVQQNRELELMRFQSGQLHLISALEPDHFQRLSARSPGLVRDAGPGLESEFLWFNQSPSAPLPDHKKQWFQSRVFRRAVSGSINRDDLVRVVYMGHATPGVGPFSPANRFWFNSRLKPHPYSPETSLRALEGEGFRLQGGQLRDRKGNAVELSLITNSGNRARERMAAMIQQDLQKIGIRLNIVALDFPSLIERFTRNYDYEACLLGLINIDLDPNGLMNVLLSSGPQHQWNPSQKTPATPWEAEIDTLMRAQAAAADPARRKAAFDRVQEIVWEEAPFMYLVYKNALVAFSGSVRGVAPAVLRPELLWNVEQISLATDVASR